MDGELREERFSLIIGDGGVYDDIVALLPVDRSGYAILVSDLQSCKDRVSDYFLPYTPNDDSQSMTLVSHSFSGRC